MKDTIPVVAAASIIALSALGGCLDGGDGDGSGTSTSTAVIETTEGTITVELYEDKMPKTTDNFIRLANDGFYDGLVFHRVIDGFMIQGGGFWPNGTEKQSPYGPIEFETHPDVTHVDGAISMARTSDPDSATSQFFICDGAQHSLDDEVRQQQYGQRGYAAFGKVIDGMDVVRDISAVQTTARYGHRDWPSSDVVIESVTVE